MLHEKEAGNYKKFKDMETILGTVLGLLVCCLIDAYCLGFIHLKWLKKIIKRNSRKA
jgi:hypothetical protein